MLSDKASEDRKWRGLQGIQSLLGDRRHVLTLGPCLSSKLQGCRSTNAEVEPDDDGE
jgi:hypothetical protein